MVGPSPEQVLVALLEGVGAGRWDEVVELYAPDAVVEHPMSGPQAPVPRWLTGAEALREHFEVVGRRGGFDVEVRDLRVHRTDDPEVVVAEFAYRGTSASRPEPFVMHNVFVTRVRAGRIVASRDYQGPPRPIEEDEGPGR